MCFVISDKHCSCDCFSHYRINSLGLCYEHQSLSLPTLQGLYKNVCRWIRSVPANDSSVVKCFEHVDFLGVKYLIDTGLFILGV